jgi:hypothetical protein
MVMENKIVRYAQTEYKKLNLPQDFETGIEIQFEGGQCTHLIDESEPHIFNLFEAQILGMVLGSSSYAAAGTRTITCDFEKLLQKRFRQKRFENLGDSHHMKMAAAILYDNGKVRVINLRTECAEDFVYELFDGEI